jgi:hypothetical protein
MSDTGEVNTNVVIGVAIPLPSLTVMPQRMEF